MNKDEIVVYKGVNDKGNRSWTSDINKAIFVACLGNNSRVFKGTMLFCELFDNSDEKNVKNINEVGFIKGNYQNVKKLIDNVLNKYSYYLTHSFIISKNLFYSKEAFGSIHGVDHCSRVLLWALIIGANYNLSQAEEHALFLSALFHDCGRKNDNAEIHGEISAKKVLNNQKDFIEEFKMTKDVIEVMKYLITFHDINDDDIPYYNETEIRTNLLLKILKDADALDRYRLSNYRFEFDVSFLRTKEAKELPLLAPYLFDFYSNFLDN